MKFGHWTQYDFEQAAEVGTWQWKAMHPIRGMWYTVVSEADDMLGPFMLVAIALIPAIPFILLAWGINWLIKKSAGVE
jgi:hypothetical protein